LALDDKADRRADAAAESCRRNDDASERDPITASVSSSTALAGERIVELAIMRRSESARLMTPRVRCHLPSHDHACGSRRWAIRWAKPCRIGRYQAERRALTGANIWIFG